jgi:metal-dependent amidase/aminoacylase/carboxypeptidase family protein
MTSSTPPVATSPHLADHVDRVQDGVTENEQVEKSLQEQMAATDEATTSQELQQKPRAMSQSFSGSVGYLANRWNLGSSFSTPSTLGRGPDDSLR